MFYAGGPCLDGCQDSIARDGVRSHFFARTEGFLSNGRDFVMGKIGQAPVTAVSQAVVAPVCINFDPVCAMGDLLAHSPARLIGPGNFLDPFG